MIHPESATNYLQRSTSARIPTPYGSYQLFHYVDGRDGKEHLALVMGDVSDGEEVLVRVHSECMTGDTFGSLRCDCGEQLHMAMQRIAETGRGIVIYLRQEGRGIGLAEKLRAYNLQDEGYDTVDANLMLGHQADEREYWAAVEILADLAVRSVRLLTNNPAKIEDLRGYGIAITERVPMQPSIHVDNAAYLQTKVARMRHLLNLPPAPPTLAGSSLPADLTARVSLLQERIAQHRAQRGTPYFTLAYAQSLDGSIAAQRGQPLALSGNVSMTLTHALRAAHDAILVGVGTLLADDPRLTVRRVAGSDPRPVVLDSTLRTPPTARIFEHPCAPLILTTARADAATRTALTARGAEIVVLPADVRGQVDLAAANAALADHDLHSVMVEGGATVLARFVAARSVNYAVVTVAPRLVGGLPALQSEETARTGVARLLDVSYTPAGDDLIIWGEPAWTA